MDTLKLKDGSIIDNIRLIFWQNDCIIIHTGPRGINGEIKTIFNKDIDHLY